MLDRLVDRTEVLALNGDSCRLSGQEQETLPSIAIAAKSTQRKCQEAVHFSAVRNDQLSSVTDEACVGRPQFFALGRRSCCDLGEPFRRTAVRGLNCEDVSAGGNCEVSGSHDATLRSHCSKWKSHLKYLWE